MTIHIPSKQFTVLVSVLNQFHLILKESIQPRPFTKRDVVNFRGQFLVSHSMDTRHTLKGGSYNTPLLASQIRPINLIHLFSVLVNLLNHIYMLQEVWLAAAYLNHAVVNVWKENVQLCGC